MRNPTRYTRNIYADAFARYVSGSVSISNYSVRVGQRRIITFFGDKLRRGLEEGLELGTRPEAEDIYSDVAYLARKFELQVAKLRLVSGV